MAEIRNGHGSCGLRTNNFELTIGRAPQYGGTFAKQLKIRKNHRTTIKRGNDKRIALSNSIKIRQNLIIAYDVYVTCRSRS